MKSDSGRQGRIIIKPNDLREIAGIMENTANLNVLIVKTIEDGVVSYRKTAIIDVQIGSGASEAGIVEQR